MKLQVAFDDVSLDKLYSIVKISNADIDIIEHGTLSVIRYGLDPLKKLRKDYPNATLLVDPKIMDAPIKIANDCFKAGADIVTVMSVAGIETVKKVIEVANNFNKEVMVDLLNDQDLINTAKKLDELGCHYLCIHSSTNDGKPNLDNFNKVKSVIKKSKLAIAGGVNLNNLDDIVKAGPDVIIVGSTIYNADKPDEMIKSFKEKMK